ncbi:MAG TPA: hypothetical protein VHO28_02845 [Ignavibacteriales bacterium]|nr:hypothetical protein [Ignavibacteriales bacterium]
MHKIAKIVFVIFLIGACGLFAQTQPGQPASGYGGSDYKHASIIKIDRANDEKGFYLYMPDNPKPDSANVIVLNHGYGALNPALYGAWINHLVKRGNIVIYPRYQENLRTSPAKYTVNSAAAILRAFELLKNTSSYVKPKDSGYIIIGHSYGGVITANEAYNFAELKLPKPKAVMICAPGTGGHDKGRYSSYKNMPADIPILLISEKDDEIVGDAFAKELYNSIAATPAGKKIWLMHHPDDHGKEAVTATHSEAVSSDKAYDNGQGRRRVRDRIEEAVPNAVDYYCYWRLADALIDAAFNTNDFSKVFGRGPEQTFTGTWSDGTPVKPLEIK